MSTDDRRYGIPLAIRMPRPDAAPPARVHVRGRVTRDGHPVPDATVATRIINVQPDTTRTDADGRFELGLNGFDRHVSLGVETADGAEVGRFIDVPDGHAAIDVDFVVSP